MQKNKLLKTYAQTNQPPLLSSPQKKQGAGGVKATSTIMGEFMAARALYVSSKEELTKRMPEGLTPEQFVVLKMLSAGDVHADDLAERSGVLAPSLSRMLNDLESMGAIKRTTFRSDSRRRLIKIRPQGKQLLRMAK